MVKREVRLQGDSVHGVRRAGCRRSRRGELRHHPGRRQRVPRVDAGRMDRENRAAAQRAGAPLPLCRRRAEDDRREVLAGSQRAENGRDASERRRSLAPAVIVSAEHACPVKKISRSPESPALSPSDTSKRSTRPAIGSPPRPHLPPPPPPPPPPPSHPPSLPTCTL